MLKRTRSVLWSKATLFAAFLLVTGLVAWGQFGRFEPSQWPVSGQNLDDTRSQPNEFTLNAENVHNLTPKWTFTSSGNVSATPTVSGNEVFFPDWGGTLYAVDKETGKQIWSHKVSDYDGFTGSFSRSSPAVDGDQVIIGDIESETVVHNGTNLISVDRATGLRRWISEVDTHPTAVITGSPVIYNGVIYVGISTNEEGLATNPAYPCCTFRGNVVAVNEYTGAVIWRTYDMPDNGGEPGAYSGGAIWQEPAIDPIRGTLYIGTGNNYTAPPSVEACQNDTPTANCTAADDYFDTAMALDLRTGHIKWAKKLQGFDTWTLACFTSANPNCPVPASPDYDFPGSGPNLLGNIVGFGQKSGIYWALNPDNGNVIWSTVVGPGATIGGIEWGTASDGQRIYIAIANYKHLPYTLISGQQITWGAWSALDVRTGKILWQTADPTSGTIDTGSVSVANGVMYAGSYSGEMYAFDARTGKILWNFATAGSVIDGPSIVDGSLYWGSGYNYISPGVSNDKVYSFSLPDHGKHGSPYDQQDDAQSGK